MESIKLGAAFLRCLGAMAVWLVFSLVAGGLFTVLFGLGGGTLALAPLLGFCGLSIHLCLWSVDRELHWALVGPVFGFMTSVVLWVTYHTDAVNPVVVLVMFLVLSAVSCLIYPVAHFILKDGEAA